MSAAIQTTTRLPPVMLVGVIDAASVVLVVVLLALALATAVFNAIELSSHSERPTITRWLR